MKKKGFTLIELLVVIAIIAMLLAILMPALNRVKRLAQRLVCATNLKGMGTAMMVYANDFEDEYPVQGGTGSFTWDEQTDGYARADYDWNNESGAITVGASLYLLVREADVSPKSFVCKSSDQKPYQGEIHAGAPDQDIELVELFDFGHVGVMDWTGPKNCVSYAYHLPYGTSTNPTARPASSSASAGFALMGDRNPWFDEKLPDSNGATVDNWLGWIDLFPIGGDWATGSTLEKWEIQATNSNAHSREGQNVLFNDGHAEFTKRSDVGYNNDNIYTYHRTSLSDPEDQRRCGYSERETDTGRAYNDKDSYLVNDVNVD